ncbi:thiol-disulfide oxidoreductase DCC family protein [Sunxiuqinia sp. sy24]|uniref:thiol-disulfide oxidoreductase DCC family protein n=1 Tax=Sunxiuqinia sp. sy24 TaxID=3461495 RepID=UPI0040454F24
MLNIPADKSLILFDGYCNLCSRSVQFILKYDRRKHFLFSALDGETGRKVKKQLDITADIDSILLVEGEQFYTHSEAILKIAEHLGGFFQVLTVVRILPKSWRDQLYTWMATNRFHWFGRRSSCMLPKPEDAERFL